MKRSFAAVLASALVFILFVTPASALRWIANGPNGGAVRAIAVNPQIPGILYLSVGGKIYGTGNRGDRWFRLHQGESFNQLDGEVVVVDPQNSTTLFVGARSGVYRSSSFGLPDSWSLFTDGLEEADEIAELAFASSANGPLYAGDVFGKIFRSDDRGESWTSAAALPAQGLNRLIALWVDPQNSDRLFAATISGVARSDDGGASWKAIEEGLPDARIQMVAGKPDEPERLLAATDEGLYRSDDAGETWFLPPPPEPAARISGFVTSFSFDPQMPNFVYASTLFSGAVYRSRDSGYTWEDIGRSLPTPSIFSVAVDPHDRDVLYAGSLGNGVYRSTDRGRNWEEADEALDRGIAYDVVVDPQNPSNVFAATFGGVHRSHDWGFFWDDDNGPNEPTVRDLAIHPRNPKILFAATNNGVARSLNRGNSWSTLSPTSQFGTIDALAIDPRNPDNVYAGTRGLLRSQDGGETWTYHNEGLPSGQITDLVLDPQAPSTLYAGTGLGLYRSLDAGSTFSLQSFENTFIHDLAIHGDGRLIYMSTSSGLYRSEDAGENWIALPLEGTAYSIALDPATPRRVYAGMAFRGVQMSEDGGATWNHFGRSFGEELENMVVRGVDVDPTSPGRVYASTEGRGVWRIEQYDREEFVLGEGRFKVEVDWRTPNSSGIGKTAWLDPTSFTFPAVQARNLGNSGVFSFFGENNWEMLVKVLDGRHDNERFWVFLSTASAVGFETVVTDTVCGVQKIYRNPVGRLAPATIDLEAFADCADPRPAACNTDADDQLCLSDDRFKVQVAWTDPNGNQGIGSRPEIDNLRVRAPAKSADSGVFYFFDPDNWEMLVKVLDGCAINGRFWVFGASATTVEYELRVTDLKTGEVWTEHQPWGGPGGAFADDEAFDGCDL